MAEWYLEGKGRRLKFSEWGLTEPVISYVSQDADVATFTYRGRWERQDDLFEAFADEVAIYKDGVKWFEGIVVSTPLMADAEGEEIQYEVKGPWIFLEEHVYAVPWTSWNSDQPGQIFCTHLVMNAAAGGVLVNTRVQTTTILNFLLSLYAADDKPFQIGEILPDGPLGDLFIPISEDRDMTCAQAVKHQLSWHRDVVHWFDYSTTPPTLHLRAAVDLGVVELALPTPTDVSRRIVSELRLAPRPDLQRPSVVIRYERTNTINGEPKPMLVVDNYPPGSTGREFGAWDATVDLVGFNKQTVHGTLVCETIEINSLAWWKRRVPELASLRLASVEISGAKRDGVGTGTADAPMPFGRMLVEGSTAPWMELQDGTPVKWERETITAKVRFIHLLADGVPGPSGLVPTAAASDNVDVLISVQVTSTNAPAGESSYEAVETFEGGDPQPIGLAEYLYNTVAPLFHSGSLLLTEAEVSGEARIGKMLKITGGRAEWATMRAMVQSVVEDIERGQTRVRFGAPDHLGPQDLIELLKVGRKRMRWTNPKTLEGELDELSLGVGPANTDSRIGPGRLESLRITTDTDFSDAGGGVQKMNQILLEAGRTIHMQQVGPAEFRAKLGVGPGGNGDGNYSYMRLADGQGSFEFDIAETGENPALPPGAREIKLRPLAVCVDGVAKRCFVMCGEPHDPPSEG